MKLLKVKLIHYLFLLVSLFSGCKKNQSSIGEVSEKSSEQEKESDAGLALLTKDDLKSRSKVHPILIDGSDFRVNGLRVSVQSYLNHETPIIFFELPELADYVEILRCRADAIIYGGQSLIQRAEMSAASLDEEAAVFGQNNFWEAAIQMAGCNLVVSSYRDLTFEDTISPSGRFFYLLRACVDQERLAGDAGQIGINCSRQVMSSLPFSYENKRTVKNIKSAERALQLRSEIDSLGRQITDKTIQLQQQLYDCQQTYQVRVVTEDERKGMATIIGLGTSAIAAGVGAAAVGLYEQRQAKTALTSTTGMGKHQISTIYKGAAGFFMIGTAGLISSLIYQYSSSKPNSYPTEPKFCESSVLNSLSRQVDAISGEKDQKSLCFCTKALSTKIEIQQLRGEFEYRIRLMDRELAAQ